MRPISVLATLVAFAAAATASHAAPAGGHEPGSAWALFSFAVSAFRVPLR